MQQTVSGQVDFKKYQEWIMQGRSFSDVRKDLVNKGYTDAEISRLIRTIDNDVQLQLHSKRRNGNARNLILMGAVVFIIGSGTTLYTYLLGYNSYVLWYGAIISGLGMFFSGLAKRE